MIAITFALLAALAGGGGPSEATTWTFRVHAREPWFRPTPPVLLHAGTTYEFTIAPGQTWTDWHDAYTSDANTTGRPADRPWAFDGMLRMRGEHEGRKITVFSLIGTAGRSLDHAFLIWPGRRWTCPVDGELRCFANDVPGFYFNNHGSMEVTVRALP